MEMLNGVGIHTFINKPDKIKVEPSDNGVWKFILTDPNSSPIFMANDLILKWAENGKNKVLLKITYVDTKRPVSWGYAIDVIQDDKLTPLMAKLVAKVDASAKKVARGG